MRNAIYVLMTIGFLSCAQSNNEPKKLESNQEIIQEPEIIGTGKITTIADGFDVKRVNLYNSTESSRKVTCFLTSGAKIKILKDEDPYYFIQSIEDENCEGYCMKGFVISD